MEPQAHWKQGAFPNLPPTKSRKPLNDENQPPRKALATLGQSTKFNTIAQTTKTKPTSSQAKLEDRLTKLTHALQVAQHAKAEALNENSSLSTELRLAAQREAKLKLALDKWEKNGASMKEKSSRLASLQTRLDELQKVHEQSKVKRLKVIQDLKEAERSKVQDVEALRKETAELKARAKEREEKMERMKDRIELLEQGTRTLQEEAKEQGAKARKETEVLRDQLERQKQQAQFSLHDETNTLRAQLAEQQETFEDDYEELEVQQAHNLSILATAAGQAIQAVRSQANSEKEELLARLSFMHLTIIELETTMDEKNAQMQELIAVVRQVQEDRDSAKQVATFADADLEIMLDEREQDRLLLQDTDSKDSVRVESDDLRTELESEQTRTLSLSSQVEDLQSQLLSITHQLAGKQGEVDTLLSKIGEGESHLSSLQLAQQATLTAKRELKAQQEANRTMSSALSNARMAESALKEERDRLSSLVEASSKYESLYLELCTQTRHLLSRHTLAESEKANLSALNAELLSHGNPLQKIMYMDRVRRELDEVKQENVDIKVELDEFRAVREELEEELKRYKSVELPLGMRPKAEVVRVRRAEELARSLTQPKERGPRPSLVNSGALRVPAQEDTQSQPKPKVPRPRQSLNPAALGKARRISLLPPSSLDPSEEDGYGIIHSTPAAHRRFTTARRVPLETIPIEEGFSDENEMTLEELLDH